MHCSCRNASLWFVLSTADYPTPAQRPAWSVLDCHKLFAAHDIAPVDWRVELEQMLKVLSGEH